MSILLSDNSSPFVCLVAVDSRVAVKCIEDTMGAALVKSNVNGYEYLKKIINLPFCLPEVRGGVEERGQGVKRVCEKSMVVRLLFD